jgi:hypothetical protein
VTGIVDPPGLAPREKLVNQTDFKEALQLADEILEVLEPLGGDGANSARALRESIQLGKSPGRKLIEPVGDALLESLMKVRSAEVPAPAGSPSATVIPSRSRVRAVYKKFREAVQGGRIA